MHIFTKMKKEIFETIDIPEGVDVSIEDNKVSIKGSEGENIREFNIGKCDLEKRDKGIVIGYKKASKNEKKVINTIVQHIKNMIKGVQEKFEYQVKICSSHFPMTVSVEGNKATIKNFLGEKIPREVRIPEGAEVEINKEIITIKSTNKEIAGQTAANFEKATRISNRDRRIFQDGLYIINKAGVEI